MASLSSRLPEEASVAAEFGLFAREGGADMPAFPAPLPRFFALVIGPDFACRVLCLELAGFSVCAGVLVCCCDVASLSEGCAALTLSFPFAPLAGLSPFGARGSLAASPTRPQYSGGVQRLANTVSRWKLQSRNTHHRTHHQLPATTQPLSPALTLVDAPFWRQRRRVFGYHQHSSLDVGVPVIQRTTTRSV